MIELKTETFITKLDIQKEIVNSFSDAIVFFQAHRNDVVRLLITTVIIDFEKQEMKHIVSYLPENILIEKVLVEKGFLKDRDDDVNPHCVIEVSKNGPILVFVERGNYFYYIDYLNNKMLVYTMDDLSTMIGEKVTSICCTVYKDKDDENFFLSSVTITNNNLENTALLYFKHRCDLSTHKLLHKVDGKRNNIIHSTKKFNNYLLGSEFSDLKVTHNNTTKSLFSFRGFVLEDLYQDYCLLNGVNYSKVEFFKKNKFNKIQQTDLDFNKFLNEIGTDFFDICKKKRHVFTFNPGVFSMLNIATGEIDYYETTRNSPAHFETDEDENIVYTSSHNFTIENKGPYFLGTAAIDKFILVEGKLKKVGTFERNDGYRFTTHKLFKYNNKKYLCTFGHPNRLFVIDAETMELVYYEDVGEDYLSDQEDILDFINSNQKELLAVGIVAIEVSQNGKFFIFFDANYIYFYDFSQRKIVQKIKHIFNFELKEGLNLNDFYRWSVHINFLK